MLPRFSLALSYTMAAFAGVVKASILDAEAADDIKSNSKLVLAVEVCRHGERGPDIIFDFTKNPEQNFKSDRSLTDTGIES